METKLHKIALVAEDVEAAVRFYTEKVGMELVERLPNEGDEDFVFLKAGDCLLELMPQKTMGADPGFHHVSFRVDSVEAGVEELEGKEVDMELGPTDGGFGITLAFFRGPDQVRLQLFERDR